MNVLSESLFLVSVFWIVGLAAGGEIQSQPFGYRQDEAGRPIAGDFLALRRASAVNDASSSNEADDDANDSNYSTTTSTATVTTITDTTTTSLPFLAARVSGHVEFIAGSVDDDAVAVATEVSVSEVLGLATWQLNVTVVSEDPWRVLFAVDLGPEFREVLVAGQQILVDSSQLRARLLEELETRSSFVRGTKESFAFRHFARLQVREIDAVVLNSTSTTLTSLTHTTTTTTQTALVFLRLLSATVHEPFDSVLFVFNMPARYARPADDNGCSPSAFATRTWQSLGHQPHCRWMNSSHLEIMFGRGATVQLGQDLITSAGAFEPIGNVAFLASPPFQVPLASGGQGLVTPRLSHPAAVQACSRVSFSVLGSTGGAGRPLQAKWFINLPTFAVVKDALQDLVDVANYEGSRILEFPPANFSVAVQRVRIVLGEISYAKIPVHVNVTAQVSNWLGAASNISGMVTVLKEEEPLPVVVTASPMIQHIATQDEVAFSVLTLSNDLSDCVSAPTTPSLDVLVDWEYRPIPGRVWTNLKSLQNLTDISRTPNTIRFAPFSFPSGTVHQFRVMAQYEGTSVMRRPNITFNVSVAVKKPPVAIIRGPSEVGNGCPFVLNASGSRDEWTMDGDLMYTWSCSPPEGTGSCNLNNLAEANFSRTDGAGASGVVMYIRGGQLTAGSYVIGLSVQRQSESIADAGNATFQVRVVPGFRPPISVEVPWEMHGGVSVTSHAGAVMARVDQTPECLVPETWSSRFLFVENLAPSRILAFLEFFTTTTTTISSTTTLTHTSTTTFTTTTSTTTTYQISDNESISEVGNLSGSGVLDDDEAEEDDNSSLGDWHNRSEHEDITILPPERLTFVTHDFPGSLLIPGSLYSYAFMFADADELAFLEENGTTDLMAVLEETDPMALAVSVPFRADAPPSRGRVIVTPSLGEAFMTDFSVATADWVDEDPELEYAFYRFPVRNEIPSTESFESWTRRFEMPDIEWDDASHPMHWRKLGGVLLRHFSLSPTLEEIRLPSGAYFVVVQARDSTHAVSTAFAAAPWVSELDIEESGLLNLLDAAQSSNDADSMINTVGAVASSPSAAEEGVAQLSLQLLLEATALVESEAVAAKCVEAVTAVLVSVTKGPRRTPEGATLQIARQAIDSSLDAMRTVNADAGALVLEGINTLGTANSWSLLRQEAAQLTSQVDSLTDKLANRLLSQLAPGQLQEVTAADAAGAGGSSILKVAKLGSASAARRLAGSVSCLDTSPVIELSALQMIHPLLASDVDSAAEPVRGPGPNVEFQESVWKSTNIYAWADPTLGVNAHVPAEASVRSFTAKACGSPVTFFNLSSPVHLRLSLLPPGSPPNGFFLVPACAKWHDASGSWQMGDLQVTNVQESQPDPALTCVSYEGAGIYAAFYAPMPEPTTTATITTFTVTTTTTTTATETTSTATGPLTTTRTSATITSTSVVWWATAVTTLDIDIPFCSESVMPESPPGAAPFTCYGPRRVGQECRAKCDPDPLNTDTAAISCLPDLSWAFSVRCPTPTEMVIVVTTETPTTSNEVLVVFGFIALGLFGGFLLAALCCVLSAHFRAKLAQAKASRVAPEVPHEASNMTDRSLASSLKSAPSAPAQLLFQTWAAESAKSLPMSPSFRTKSPERPQPLADLEGREPPAGAGDLRTLTVEESFWDWAKEWSHASVVQSAMPDPSMQLATAQELPASVLDGEDEDAEEEGLEDTAAALQLQNIGSDSDDAAPKALTN